MSEENNMYIKKVISDIPFFLNLISITGFPVFCKFVSFVKYCSPFPFPFSFPFSFPLPPSQYINYVVHEISIRIINVRFFGSIRY